MSQPDPKVQESEWSISLNTDVPPTIAQVMEFLREYPPDWRVRAYEGEGGAWIVVDKPAPTAR
jgi:hypothetical protein